MAHWRKKAGGGTDHDCHGKCLVVSTEPGDLVDNAIKTNGNMTAVRLLTRNLLLKHAAADERVKIVAALNKLDTSTIELLVR
jgi:hypothetical protein